jgi:hypothetical protein
MTAYFYNKGVKKYREIICTVHDVKNILQNEKVGGMISIWIKTSNWIASFQGCQG